MSRSRSNRTLTFSESQHIQRNLDDLRLKLNFHEGLRNQSLEKKSLTMKTHNERVLFAKKDQDLKYLSAC
jgi:hypothetical protein